MSPLVGILREQLDSTAGKYVPRTLGEHVAASLVNAAVGGDVDATRLIFELTYVSDYDPAVGVPTGTEQPAVSLCDDAIPDWRIAYEDDPKPGYPADDPK